MLRADETTGNVFGFVGEGGYVSFANVDCLSGVAVITVKGNETVQKREFLFGQENIIFPFLPEEIDKLGAGEHPYSLYIKDKNGTKNTLIPDPKSDMRPTFNIESEE